MLPAFVTRDVIISLRDKVYTMVTLMGTAPVGHNGHCLSFIRKRVLRFDLHLTAYRLFPSIQIAHVFNVLALGMISLRDLIMSSPKSVSNPSKN